VQYSQDEVAIQVPVYENGTTASMHYTINALYPETGYEVLTTGCGSEAEKAAPQQVKTDALGILQFDATARVQKQLCRVTIKALQKPPSALKKPVNAADAARQQ
jgi:hypothetical protein